MLNKKNLARKLAKRSILTVPEAEQAIATLLELITDELCADGEVSLVGFGKFYLYEHTPRPVRNPKTQEEMTLQKYKSVRFKPSDLVKSLLKEKLDVK